MKQYQLLCECAVAGNAQEVERLIPLTQPKLFNSLALKMAVSGENLDCVKLLIGVSDVGTDSNTPLKIALSRDNQQLFDVLYPHSDPENIQQMLGEDHTNLLREHIARYENNLITQKLDDKTLTPRLTKKI